MSKDFDNSNKNFNQHNKDFYNGYPHSKNSARGNKFALRHNGVHQRDQDGGATQEVDVTFDFQYLDQEATPEERLQTFRKANETLGKAKKKKSGE